MKQAFFEERYRAVWQEFEAQLSALEGQGKRRQRRQALAQAPAARFPELYRALCLHLTLARDRGYRPDLIDELNGLVARGHHQLYHFQPRFRIELLAYLVAGFPRLVREEWRLVLTATLLFVVPAVFFFLIVQWKSALVFSLLDAGQVVNFESMYDPASDHVGRDRAAASDLHMFGYYIYNNISVAFRCFAGGLLFMVGAAISLFFNGMLIGGVAGHLENVGYSAIFYPFVIGHSAFELTAIVLSGAAGLRLGHSLLAPGNLSRLSALREAARTGIRLIYGVMIMLIVAAFLEAFWSSNAAIAPTIRYGIGAGLWVLVFAYFILAGRRHGH